MTSSRAGAPAVTAGARTAYLNGRVLVDDPALRGADAVGVVGDRIALVGTADEVRAALPHAAEVDLGGALLAPGFVDGHFHTLSTGESLGRVDLVAARTLADIQRLVRDHAATHPEPAWVLGRSWLFEAVPDRRPTAAMLDAAVPDRPVMLDANDLHSTWVNTAGLRRLGITAETPDPVGGRIARDPATGEPTGFLEETAAERYGWSHLRDATGDADLRGQLRAAVQACHGAGITGVVDMAMTTPDLALLASAEREGRLGLRVVAHCVVDRDGTTADHLARVAEVAEQARRHRSNRLRVAGLKIWVDGVIDGCTAAVSEPYVDGSRPDALWELDALVPVVAAADAAGLQVAMHAIGDRAVRIALDAVEEAQRRNGTTDRRHRIEHIEYLAPSDVPRLAQLGVTASMQPVHCDPAIQGTWREVLGPHRSERAFPAKELADAGATLVLGTDAPTAPYAPLRNLYVATTRRSALAPGLPANIPRYALPVDDALRAATASSAWACFAEGERGRIAPGLLADLVVVDPDPRVRGAESLLTAQVVRTVVGGVTVFERPAYQRRSEQGA